MKKTAVTRIKRNKKEATKATKNVVHNELFIAKGKIIQHKEIYCRFQSNITYGKLGRKRDHQSHQKRCAQ